MPTGVVTNPFPSVAATSGPTSDGASYSLSLHAVPGAISQIAPPALPSEQQSAPPNTQTAAAASNRPTTSLRRPVFIGASAGLSAAAFVTIVAAILLYRRDRRLTRAAKQAQLSRTRGVDLLGYASEGLQWPGLASADNDGTPHYGAQDPALGSSLFYSCNHSNNCLMPTRTPATATPVLRCQRCTCTQDHRPSTYPGDL